MNLIDVLGSSFASLRGNWLRSILTALGVIIGISAVIVMVAIGQGTQSRLDETISRLGSNRMDISSAGGRQGGARMAAGSQATLTESDAEAIRKSVPNVSYVGMSVRGGAQVVYGAENWSTSVYGVNQDFMTINNYNVIEGETFTERDVQAGAKVLLIGKTTREKLFGDADPIGQTMRVSRVPFKVIGILVERGQSGWGGDQDDVVMMPISTAKRRVLGGEVNLGDSVQQISVSVDRPENLKFVETELAMLLRQRHKIGPGAQDDFQIRNLAEIISARTETTRLMSLLLGAVALISLIVGGIGIMNIMLVSVTERIREIGLRLAVGASPNAIRSQFMAEAMMISLGGGIIGIVLGIAATYAAAELSALPVVLSADIIFIATGFSVATGLFFGFYPAHKAAQLDPIEALRQG